jgi:hypothetical protein
MDLQPKDWVVLATGGARSIGVARVRTVAQKVRFLCCSNRDPQAGERLRSELQRFRYLVEQVSAS